ncbi:uncharacterized protein LOC110990947 [Acanthaster planci]|uniref:Uncharacterized protein LOC110990947 n=1 Tax=Acanthaster planci TaxID=133434 RepID=A0A8B8A2W7_ACAPL|nr:uncharacterized protein LOC110990947 [Acanthaster planci]
MGASVSSFVTLRLHQGVLEWGGPAFMKSFAEDPFVIGRFKEAAIQRPSNLFGSNYHESRFPPPSSPPTCDTPANQLSAIALRRVITRACNPKHVKRFWTDELNKPSWWPGEIPFQSPNWVSGDQQRLNVFQLSAVYEAYTAHSRVSSDAAQGPSPSSQAGPPPDFSAGAGTSADASTTARQPDSPLTPPGTTAGTTSDQRKVLRDFQVR